MAEPAQIEDIDFGLRRDELLRLENFLRSTLGCNDERGATLCRVMAEKLEPASQYREFLDLQVAGQAGNESHKRGDALRKERQRVREALGLRTLRAYPAVCEERIARLFALGLLPDDITTDAELVDALIEIAHGISDMASGHAVTGTGGNGW